MTLAQAIFVERPEERIVSLEVRRDGVAVVRIDDPREESNTITTGFWPQLHSAIDRIDEDASIAAAVLASGKTDNFIIGVGTDLLRSIKFATDAERVAREGAHVCARLEASRKPIVAAVGGPALGGGFELALACHALVASDAPETRVGLPEVRLGLLPAANGMLRAAMRTGLRSTMDLVLTGRKLRSSDARAIGLLDDVCPRAILLDAAARLAKSLVGHEPRVAKSLRVRRLDLRALAVEQNPLGRAILFGAARERARTITRGHYPAAERILDVLEVFASRGFAAAAELEAKCFGELVVGETAHRLIELSFATRSLQDDSGADEPVVPGETERIAVVGGGAMGAAIASVSLRAGLPVRLKEQDDAAVGRAVRLIKELLDGRTDDQELSAGERERAFARLSVTSELTGLRVVDAVIEAVTEDLPLKQQMLRDIEPLVGPTCVLASCTSAIPISKIALAVAAPERVLGMHYFKPVARMPLLEVIRAEKTAGWAVARAVALGKRQGKTVIVVRDGPGFYTTRILAPLLSEAVQLVAEGVPFDSVDSAMLDWGFAVGPIRLLDEIGIDTCFRVAQGLQAAIGARMTPPGSLAKMLADDRLGRKNGRGFYRYGADVRQAQPSNGVRGPWSLIGRRAVDPEVYPLLGTEPKIKLPAEEVQMRCGLALVNEGVRAFGDGVLRSARDGDVGAVYGFGFPAFRGGPFRYVDTIGAAEVLRRIQGYADRFGERWRPAPVLVQMAKKGERFYP